jgi:cyanate lyase
MSLDKANIGMWLKRKIDLARAASDLSWADIAERLSKPNAPVSAASLRNKHSRLSFTAVELVAVLQVLGVEMLDVREEQPGQKRRRRVTV